MMIFTVYKSDGCKAAIVVSMILLVMMSGENAKGQAEQELPESEDIAIVRADEERSGDVVIEDANRNESAEDHKFFDAATLIESAGEAPPREFSLRDDEVTIPSDLTVFESVKHIMGQLPLVLNYKEMLSTNDIAKIKSTPSTFSTGKPVVWKTALEEVVGPHGLDYIKDGEIVRIGPSDVIQEYYKSIEQERLDRNHTRIQVNFSEGTKLYLALRMIQSQSGININFDYMAAVDRGVDTTSQAEADDVEQQSPLGNLTTYSTPENQAVQWRTVLHEVLDPFDYDFVEVNGVVRPMKKADVKKWEKEQINAKPIVTRLVRVYHASVEDCVSRLEKMKSLLKHENAFIEVTQSENDKGSHSKRYSGSGFSSSSSMGSGEKIGAEMRDSINYADMERPRTSPAILIGDIRENLDRIEDEIQKMDTRGKQVLIEAKIFEVGVNTDRQLGVNWEEFGGRGDFSSSIGYEQEWMRNQRSDRYDPRQYSTTSDYQTEMDLIENEEISRTGTSTFNGNITDTLNTALERTFSKTYGSAFTAILNPLEFSFYWNAVRQQNDFENLSQPVVVIGDHSEAVIRVGTIIPAFSKVSRFIENNAAESYEWQMIQTGISLWVVPEIAKDGEFIRLSLHPQESSAGSFVTAGENGEGGRYPTIEIREVDTRVSVRSGHTLMLGGLIRSGNDKAQSKIPLLGDIPILGRLFRWDSDTQDGRNLIILMTPTILDDDEPDTGYEKASQPFIDNLSRGLGRNLTNEVPKVEQVIKERKERKAAGRVMYFE
jgi:type II secretory pathway component GspD/PulD (secretin)